MRHVGRDQLVLNSEAKDSADDADVPVAVDPGQSAVDEPLPDIFQLEWGEFLGG